VERVEMTVERVEMTVEMVEITRKGATSHGKSRDDKGWRGEVMAGEWSRG
jgi:hypothetical protein